MTVRDLFCENEELFLCSACPLVLASVAASVLPPPYFLATHIYLASVIPMLHLLFFHERKCW